MKISFPKYLNYVISITDLVNSLVLTPYGTSGLVLITLTQEALLRLTQTLFKTRTNQTLQIVNGMIVRMNGDNYIFVGYLKPPMFLIPTKFCSEGTLISKSFTENRTMEADLVFDETDYSIPPRGINSYLDSVECFNSRSRGEYFCIFRNNIEFIAVSKTGIYHLNHTETKGIDTYTKEALLYICALSGLDIDKMMNGEELSNFNENSYILVSVRSPSSVFYDPTRGKFDVSYINGNLRTRFYIPLHMRQEFLLYFRENVGEKKESKVIPCSNPLWVKYFRGFKKNYYNKIQDEPQENPTNLTEYPILEVYNKSLMTTLIYCNEQEYIIDLLTMESSNVFDVARKIQECFTSGQINTYQYSEPFPPGYSTPLEFATDYFTNETEGRVSNLLWLLSIPPELTTKPEIVKSFIKYVYGGTPIVLVKEKIEKTFTQEEYLYETQGQSNRRVIVSAYEGFKMTSKCNLSFSKTFEDKIYGIRIACDISRSPNNERIRCVPSDFKIRISSSPMKIICLLFILTEQRKMKGSLDIDKALEITETIENIETPESETITNRTHILHLLVEKLSTNLDEDKEKLKEYITSFNKIHRTHISHLLLEKLILILNGVKYIEIKLSEIEDYSSSLNKSQAEFISHIYTGYCIEVSNGIMTYDISKVSDPKSISSKIAFSFPEFYDIIPYFEDVNVEKPITELQTTETHSFKTNHDSLLSIIFEKANMDFYLFKTMKSSLKKSTYIYDFYKKIISSPELIRFVDGFIARAPKKEVVAIQEELIEYKQDYSNVMWIPFAGF